MGQHVGNQPIARRVVTAIRAGCANHNCNLPHATELLCLLQESDYAGLKQRLVNRAKQDVLRRRYGIKLGSYCSRGSKRFFCEYVKARLESRSNCVYVLFRRCRDMHDVGKVSRQGVTDANRKGRTTLFGKLSGAIRVGIDHGGDSSPCSSHRVSVPTPHEAGTDDHRPERRARDHDAVADTSASSRARPPCALPTSVRWPVAAAL